ncbi:hypothetical protein [Hyalangium sp.]|uniref:hypothetical protein n=1 Tax=Hyalangium sp. TaxID=2028555 RepID=UPI002D429B17|nr:hypothetical protein [Hyalangium sp.]HYH95145.1 hypothetical protein [Hyalangium sp.]
MRLRRRLTWLCCAVVLAGCTKPASSLVPEAGAPLPVRLDFRPPVDRAMTERVQMTRTVERGGARQSEEAEMTTVTHFTPAESGWQLAQTVARARMTRGGTPVETVVDEVLTRFPLRVRLAADGAFVKVLNADEGLKALRQGVPAGQQTGALEAFFSPEALEVRTRREWEAKYGGLLQRNLMVGQHTWAVEGFSTAEGEVRYLLQRTVTGTELTDQGDALVLSLKCLDGVPEDAPSELREVVEEAGGPELTPGVTCEGEQVVARGYFVPMRRTLSVRVKVGDATWTLATQTKLELLEEARR